MLGKITPLYSGTFDNFRWAGFGSGSGTNIRQCARVKRPSLIFSDRPEAPLLGLPELVDVHKLAMDGYSFCGSWKAAQGNIEKEKKYQKKSREFNLQILSQLQEFESRQGKLDLIVLGGYMRLLSEPMLTAYADKIINVHPADLSILVEGKRKYVGANAIADALRAGEPSTRSSIILVDKQIDHGEIITQGPKIHYDIKKCSAFGLEGYFRLHQQRQKEQSDWIALATAFTFLAHGRLAIGQEKIFHNEWRRVYLDGQPLPYEGFRINK